MDNTNKEYLVKALESSEETLRNIIKVSDPAITHTESEILDSCFHSIRISNILLKLLCDKFKAYEQI